MRIRRYAARLLASSTSTAPSSPPPQPAASWFHVAADDCAFCELGRPAPQVSPDGIKHKGHIASRLPEAELQSDDCIGLAKRPPVPEAITAQGCNMDDERPVANAAAGLEVARGASGVSGAAVRLEGTGGAFLVSEAANELTAKEAPFIANEATGELEVRGTTLLVDEPAAEPEVSAGASPVNGSITEPEVLREACANEAVVEPEGPRRVSYESETASEPVVIATVSELAGIDNAATEPEDKRGASIVNASAAKMVEVIMGASLNEASTELGFTERISLACETVTEQGVTGAGSHNNASATEPEATGGAILVNEDSETDIAGIVHMTYEAAAVPDVTGGASAFRGVGDAALDRPRPPDCDVEIINMKVENAGDDVASTLQSSRDDAADAVGSVSSTSNDPVRSNGSTSNGSEVVTHHNGFIDTPSVSCVSDIVARSVGKSGRLDIICYARRRGKRKMEMVGIKTEQFEMDDGAIYDQCEEKAALEKTTGPCESAMSTAGSTEIKIADIKRELKDSSAASKGKRAKIHRFECEIDYCRMKFKTRAELSVHKKNMCTIKSCSRHFRSHKYLRRHQSIHSDDMPYKCPWEGCSMAFKSTWALAEHFQVHTGEKPYKCMTHGCSKIFKYVSDFIRHRRRCKPQR